MAREMAAIAALMILGLCSLPRTAWAQDDDLEATLEEGITTSVSGRALSTSSAPATVTVIGSEDLTRFGVRSLDEALDFLGLGIVTQNPLHSVDIGARGVLLTGDFGNHVVLLFNGQVMNEPWDGTAYFERGAAIPFELVDHIEVSLGPGSVSYGGNAMLAVVNVVTKRARDFLGTHLVLEGELIPPSTEGGALRPPHASKTYLTDLGRGFRIAAGYGGELELFGWAAQIVGEVDYYAQHGPALAFDHVTYGTDSVTGEPKRFSEDGTLAGVWGGVARSSYFTRVPALHTRLSLGNLDLELRAAINDRSTPYANLFNAFVGDFDAPSREQDRFLGVHARHQLWISPQLSLSSRLFANVYAYTQDLVTSAAEDCAEGQLEGCRPRTEGTSRWVGAEEQLFVDWWRDGVLDTLVGAELRLRRVAGRSEYFDRITGASPGLTSSYAETEVVAALYVQQNLNLFERLHLNASARLDRDPRVGVRLSPRAAAVLDVEGGATAKLIYAEAFRGPTAYEFYYGDLTSQIPGHDLGPETARSVELSIEQRQGTFQILLGGFYSWWHDLVVLEQLSAAEVSEAIARGELTEAADSVLQYRNASSLRNFGVNLAMSGSLGGRALRYGVTVTAAHTERKYADSRPEETLPVAPTVFGNARLSYLIGEDGTVVSLASRFVGRRPADRAFDGGFVPRPEGPADLQLRATLGGPVPWISSLHYRISADVRTASRSAYVAGPVQAATEDQPSAVLAPLPRLLIATQLSMTL